MRIIAIGMHTIAINITIDILNIMNRFIITNPQSLV